LRAELAVVHDLKKGMLLGRSEEPRSALGILPHGYDVTLEALTRSGCLERGVGIWPVRGVEKRNQNRGSPDIQIGDRNRMI
jgi:hypothetical protein